MPGSTPVYGFPYPEATDLVADYPALGQELAEDIEAALPTVGGLAPATPTSIANSGGSASVSGNTVTFTGVTSVSLNGCFSADYSHYRVLVSGLASGNQWFYMRLRASSTDQTGTNYNIQRLYGNVTSATATNSASQAQLQIGDWDATGLSICEMTVWNPFDSGRTAVSAVTNRNTNAARIYYTQGGYNAAYSADGFTIYCTGYTITGTVSVYGFKS